MEKRFPKFSWRKVFDMYVSAIFVFPNESERRMSFSSSAILSIDSIVASSSYKDNYFYTSIIRPSDCKYVIAEICDGKYYLEKIK